MVYGTLSSYDTLLANRLSVAEFGEDRTYAGIAAMLAAHNTITTDMMGDLVERTTDNMRAYGGIDSMTMEELDEFGSADAQKVGVGTTLGFPLRRYGRALQWTRIYMLRAAVADIAAQVQAMQDADVLNIQRRFKEATFNPTNRVETDRLALRKLALPIKAFVNGDGEPIPPGPNGEIFNGATHTHYLANSSLTAAALSALVTTITEHIATGTVVLYIAQGDEAALRTFNLPGQFTQYVDGRVVMATTQTYAAGSLDMINANNRAIGLYGAAEVWVKPWIPAGYAACFARTPGMRPLVMRYDPVLYNGTLALEYDDEEHPLRANGYARYFGMGAWNRAGAAVLDFTHPSYTMPTI